MNREPIESFAPAVPDPTVGKHEYLLRCDSVDQLYRIATAKGQLAKRDGTVVVDSDVTLCERNTWFNNLTAEGIGELLKSPPATDVRSVASLKSEIDGRIVNNVGKKRRVRRRVDDGDDIDIDRYLERDYDRAFDRIERTNFPRRVISVVVNSSVNCGQNAGELAVRGAVAAVLCDTLASIPGVCVEVDLALSTGELGQIGSEYCNATVLTTVKQANQPLDIPLIAFTTGNIGFLRRICLSAERNVPVESIRYGMGFPRSLPKAQADRYDIVIEQTIRNVPSAIDALKRILRDLGDDLPIEVV